MNSLAKNLRLFATFSLVVVACYLSGCASSKMKARKDQRDTVANSSKLWCEFINGEIYPDIDVALNLEMARRCDSNKNFSITQYRTPSENQGIMYCCAMQAGAPKGPVAVIEKDDDKKSDKKAPAEKAKSAADVKASAAKGDGEFIDESPQQ